MPPTSALNTSYTHVSVPSSETNVWNPRHGGGGGAKHFPNKTCIFENRKSVEIKFGIVKTKRHPTQNSIATMLEFEKLIKVFCVWIFRSLLDWQIAPTRCDLTCDALHMAEGGVRSTPHLKASKPWNFEKIWNIKNLPRIRMKYRWEIRIHESRNLENAFEIQNIEIRIADNVWPRFCPDTLVMAS